jgi:hypothetical protein
VAEEPLLHLTLGLAIEVPLPAIRATSRDPAHGWAHDGHRTGIDRSRTVDIVPSLPHADSPTDVRCGQGVCAAGSPELCIAKTTDPERSRLFAAQHAMREREREQMPILRYAL